MKQLLLIFILLLSCSASVKIIKTINKDGSLLSEESYKNGKLHGKSIYYSDDLISSEVNYKNGKEDGLAITYDGNPYYILDYLHYKNGKLHGTQYIFERARHFDYVPGNERTEEFNNREYIPQALVSTENYIDGKLMGLKTIYYVNGQIEQEIMYQYNKPVSNQTYYLNGQLKQSIKYKNGKPTKKTNFYQNGSILDTCNIANSQTDLFDCNGEYRSYYQSGALKTKENRIGGYAKIGKFEHYYESGKMKVSGNYKLTEHFGVLDGSLKTFFENGNLQSEAIYKNGKLNGIAKTYSANNELLSEINFKNGRPVGLFKLHQESQNNDTGLFKIFDTVGDVLYEISFKNKIAISGTTKQITTDVNIGKIEYRNATNADFYNLGFNYQKEKAKLVLEFYSDGSLQSETYYLNNKKDGLFRAYFSDGALRTETYFTKGKMNGLFKEYYLDNNKIKIAANYKNGKLDGNFKLFAKCGGLLNDRNYVNGKLEGETITYGQFCESSYDGFNMMSYYESNELYKDLEHVDSTYISSSGPPDTLHCKMNFKNNKLDGKVICYEYYSDLIHIENYTNGIKNGLSQSLHSNGNIRSETNYKDGKKDGYSKNYHANGKVSEIELYKSDNLIGHAEIYYENGQLYNYENVNGDKKYFYPSGALMSEITFSKSKSDKKILTYYENGNIKSETNYKNNKLNGIYKVYDENKTLMAEVNFKNSKQKGLFRIYSKNKNHSKQNDENKPSGQLLIYDEIGKLFMKLEFENGLVKEGKLYIEGEYYRDATNADYFRLGF
jgi:antitoxin component YwqK of YwqJK toxin-antitoxin module